jgi:hypothetical protein
MYICTRCEIKAQLKKGHEIHFSLIIFLANSPNLQGAVICSIYNLVMLDKLTTLDIAIIIISTQKNMLQSY